ALRTTSPTVFTNIYNVFAAHPYRRRARPFNSRSPSMRLKAIVPAIGLVLTVSTTVLAGPPRAVKAFDPTRIDTSVKPCVDFNRYANGAWLDAERIPEDHGSWGAFDMLYEQNLTLLHDILERASKASAPAGSA